jgi:uncharacterized membrane protein
MSLTPEERRRIYEEEKARLEAEKAQREQAQGTSLTGLKQNVASMLCYLGLWVTGIIFLVLEKQNRVVRFHAAQSLMVFGFLSVTSFILGFIPVAGGAISTGIGLVIFILWIVLMVKAYQGEVYHLPVAGDIAEDIAGVAFFSTPATGGSSSTAPPPPAAQPAPGAAQPAAVTPYPRTDWGRAGRLTAYAFGIAWDVVLIIFLNFFNQYIAYYHTERIGGGAVWIREPFLTSDFSSWLPIATAALALAIVGHIILIIIDTYAVRTAVRLAMDAVGLWAVSSLLSIFPFDFSAIPERAAQDATVAAVAGVLGLIIFILAVAIIVRLVRLILHLTRLSPGK